MRLLVYEHTKEQNNNTIQRNSKNKMKMFPCRIELRLVFVAIDTMFSTSISLYSVTDFALSNITDEPAYNIPYFPCISSILHNFPDSISFAQHLAK